MAIEIGMAVGSGRIPYSASHPDCWRTPWTGIVLARNDRRAWEGTLVFSGLPSQEKVDAHVAYCEMNDLFGNLVPVIWNFGSYQKIFWERPETLKPAVEDLADFLQLRQEAKQALSVAL